MEGNVFQYLLKSAYALVWAPVVVIVGVLVSLFFQLEEVWMLLDRWRYRHRYNRMSPEQKRTEDLQTERELLEAASRVRLSPSTMESEHPLLKSYRELHLGGEAIALKMRERREAAEK
jgi:hypothetical protein